MKKRTVIMPHTSRYLITLGEQIKLARLRRKLPESLVAERAMVSRTTVWSIESGSSSVSMGAYAAVLHAIDGSDKFLAEILKDDPLGRLHQDLELPLKKEERERKEKEIEEAGTMQKPFILMHGTHPAAALLLDPLEGQIQEVTDIMDASHLPLPARFVMRENKKWLITMALRNFWKMRLMPRRRYRDYEGLNKEVAVGAVALSGYGMSLSDGWWLRPAESPITWDDVNGFDHPFSSFLNGQTALYSPDFCTNGNLPKFWQMKEGIRYLYKEGNEETETEAYNEVIASNLLDILNLPHIPYTLEHRDFLGKRRAWSVCPAFTSKQVEYIPAWYIWDAVSDTEGKGPYIHFLRCLKEVGLGGIQKDLDHMLAFDFLINNTDRHYGNFGFLRNIETLEWIGMAPIFDNGNSLWFDPRDIPRLLGQPARPFWDEQMEQFSKLTDFFDVGSLSDDFLTDCIREGMSPKVTPEKTEEIIKVVLHRKKLLERKSSANSKKHSDQK